jgi:anti-sigma factor RsiW
LIETAKQNCPGEDVAAYLDGELTGHSLQVFESHLAECSSCAVELRQQRQLLCTLDAAFNSSNQFSLPAEFTRVIATHAESDLRGLRGKSERRRAAQLCAILGLSAFALLGATSGVLVFQPVRNFLQLFARVFELAWQTTSDATESLGIILRVIARAAIGTPYVWPALIGLALVVAVSVLSRLIGNYHRTQIIE